MAFCEHCGGEVTEEAQYCPNCGKAKANVQTSSPAPREKKKQPVIGFFGMLLIGAGLCAMFADGGIAGFMILAAGVLILIYALFTGNLKFLG